MISYFFFNFIFEKLGTYISPQNGNVEYDHMEQQHAYIHNTFHFHYSLFSLLYKKKGCSLKEINIVVLFNWIRITKSYNIFSWETKLVLFSWELNMSKEIIIFLVVSIFKFKSRGPNHLNILIWAISLGKRYIFHLEIMQTGLFLLSYLSQICTLNCLSVACCCVCENL